VSTQVSEVSGSQPSLRLRTIRAGFWTLGQHGFEATTRFITNLILTRLLVPEAFGEVSAALAVITGLGLISDFGVQAVIIQNARGDQDDFLRSAWVFLMWRGLLLWAVLCVICLALTIPWVHDLLPSGSVFASDLFPRLTAVLGLSLVVGEARSTAVFVNARQLNLGPIVTIDITCRIVSIVVVFAWALWAPSAWAIVASIIAGEVVRTVLSHVIVPGPRMAFRWERHHFREIVRFGKWVWVSTLGAFVSTQSEVILLGILLSSPMFGVYVIAKLLVDSGELLLSRIESALSLPVLSEIIRKRPSELRDQYYRLRLPIELASACASGILFASGGFIVGFLYDQRYAGAGLMVQIMAIRLALYPCGIIQTAFVATGETRLGAGLSTFRAVSMIGCITGGFFLWGPLGTIAGLSGFRILSSGLVLFYANKRHWISAWRELRIVPAFVAGAVVAKVAVGVMAGIGLSNIANIFQILRQ